jgi:polyhydroxybutyrate depolymerase
MNKIRFFSFLSIVFLIVILINHAEAKEYVIKHNQEERSLLLRKPKALIGSKAPAIIVLHGGGGSGHSAEKITNFTRKALPHGFMVAYPSGTGRLSFLQTGKVWNAVHCCGYAMENQIDDIDFIHQLINDLVRNHNADPKRIYVTGMSNGAMLTHLIGIHLSDKVSAIAPVVGGMFGGEETPSVAVPTLIINGAQDSVIKLRGGAIGRVHKRAYDGTPFKPSSYQAQFWAQANRCGLDYTTRDLRNGNLTVFTYDCPSHADVIYYVVNDGNHSWPGGKRGRKGADKPSNTIDATQVIIDFFLKHDIKIIR